MSKKVEVFYVCVTVIMKKTKNKKNLSNKEEE